MTANTLALHLARKLRVKLEEALPGRILEVRLYGSQATGEAHEASDLDVFVLVDERDSPTWDVISRVAFEVWNSVDGAPLIVPFVRSREQFDEMVRRERPLARDILEQGIPV